MICAMCGNDNAQKIVIARKGYWQGKEVTVVEAELHHCSSWNEEYFSPEQAKTFIKQVQDLIVEM